MPLFVLALCEPSEGLPVFTDWIRTANDIWYNGYEVCRDNVEARPQSTALLGGPMQLSSLVPTKGITRVSIIMFGLVYTYQNLQKEMTDSVKADFARLGWGAWGLKGGQWLNAIDQKGHLQKLQ